MGNRDFKKARATLLDQRGESLLMVMVAAGILGVIMTGVASGIIASQKGAAGVEQQLDVAALNQSILTELANSASCINTVNKPSALNVTSGLPRTLTNIRDKADAVVYTVGTAYQSKKINLASLTLVSHTVVDTTQGTMILQLNYGKVVSTPGPTSFTRQIRLKTVRDASGVLQSCQAFGFVDSLWKEVGNGDIYYDTGKVGIGTSTPVASLHVTDMGATDQANYVDSATQPMPALSVGAVFDSSYTDGRWRTRLVNVDRGGNIPLYIQQSGITANTFKNVARFGSQQYDSNNFVVFGDELVTGKSTVGLHQNTKPYLKIGKNDSTNDVSGFSGLLFGAWRDIDANYTSGIVAKPTWTCCGWPGGGYAGVKSNDIGIYPSFDPTGAINYDPAMVVRGVGTVGIGTTLPKYHAEVVDTASSGIYNMRVKTNGPYSGLLINSNNSSAAIANRFWGIANTNEYAGRTGLDFIEYSDDNGNDGLCDGGETCSVRMSITAGGNVGIGTTSPAAKLEVKAGYEGQTGPVEAIRIWGPNTPVSANSAQDLRWTFAAAGSSKIRAFRGGSWDTYIQFLTNPVSAGVDNPQVRLHIDQSGSIGIGTTVPAAKLHVTGWVVAETDAGWRAYMGGDSGGGDIEIGTLTSGINTLSFWNRGAGTYMDTYATSFHATSDRRLKTEIQPLDTTLEKVLSLEPVSYKWRNPASEPGRHLGFIAQDVDKVFPEAVTKSPKGFWTLAYTDLIAPLVEAFKEFYEKWQAKSEEQDQKIAEQARLVAEQARQLEEQRARIVRLENEARGQREEMQSLRSALCETNPNLKVCH